MKTKRKTFKVILNIHSIKFQKSPEVSGTEPRIQFFKAKNRIQNHDDSNNKLPNSVKKQNATFF